MPTEVVAALLGDPLLHTDSWEGQIRSAERRRPYDERPKVVLSVSAQETLGRVIERAVDLFKEEFPDGDFRGAGNFFGFFHPTDEKEIADEWMRMSTTVTLVNAQGHALWHQWAADASYGDLIAAANAGALLGDPRRPYVVLSPPQGNGLLGSWQDVINAWHTFVVVLEGMAVAGGAMSVPFYVRQLLDRPAPRDVPAVVERNRSGWDARGGSPLAVGEFLSRGDLPTPRVAELLDCTVEETRTLLRARGLREADDGTWRPEDDPGAEALRRVASRVDAIRVRERAEMEELLRRVILDEDP